jgi:5-methylcytosine-specific restriction endonuclease McrA
MSKPRPNQKVLRYAVFQRDHGICSSCGFDCEALRLRLLALPYYEREMERRRLGVPHGRTTAWDVHHLVAVCDGGPDTLTNCTTLCWRCHSIKTRELIYSLAHERAAGRPPHAALGRSDLMEIFG